MKTELSNPFNYVGSKYRYLKDLFEVLPDDENLTVCDPFCGGGDLCSNLPEFWTIDASDSMPQIVEMHNAIYSGEISAKKVAVRSYLSRLNNKDEKSFNKFKAMYNKSKEKHPIDLYALICHSNSNRIRFSSKGFNVPFGNRWFNLKMVNKLDNYIERLLIRDISFKCKSAFDVNFYMYDLTLIDPPYLNTCATYNENGGWSLAHEKKLHDKIKSECNKFVYFGQTWSKGVHNELLEEFSTGYNVKVLKDTTRHCSANRNDKDKTVEVMIWN